MITNMRTSWARLDGKSRNGNGYGSNRRTCASARPIQPAWKSAAAWKAHMLPTRPVIQAAIRPLTPHRIDPGPGRLLHPVLLDPGVLAPFLQAEPAAELPVWPDEMVVQPGHLPKDGLRV